MRSLFCLDVGDPVLRIRGGGGVEGPSIWRPTQLSRNTRATVASSCIRRARNWVFWKSMILAERLAFSDVVEVSRRPARSSPGRESRRSAALGELPISWAKPWTSSCRAGVRGSARHRRTNSDGVGGVEPHLIELAARRKTLRAIVSTTIRKPLGACRLGIGWRPPQRDWRAGRW